ncbi:MULTISPECIES: DHA2 family efflux MFS transporter permease subunit [unclassified Arthrobacter]|uniref:DHA2 family efflux MFS transporter permease subunit n=1 Tax=unclassified Arthrobacter TaxID=235627 RepID=UPI000CE32436|nr:MULTISPECIES: DHA2 family efflux MFS transporter permease subunit [unclassified Arthrobacter]
MRSTTSAGTSSFSRALALLVAGTYFMEILDGTIIATAAPGIAADLQVRPVDINLAMTSYLITLAVGIPISGWLAERFGARRVFTAAIAIFTIASLLCALSPNLTFLCIARMLQGLGGAMMVPVGRLVVLRDADRKEFLEAIAYLTWPALIAPVLAPVLGGLLVTYASWHWIFLLNVPLGVIAFIVATRVVPDIRARKVPPPDWVGFVLCGVGLAALVIGMELIGSAPTPWLAVVLWLVLAAVATVAALVWFKRSRHPLLDMRALRIHTFLIGNAGGALYRLIINAVPFLLPLMFMIGFGWTAFEAGLMTMAVFAGNVLIKPATSPLIRRFGFRRVLLLSNAGGALVLVACAFLNPDTPLTIIAAVLFVSGVLRSIGFSAYNTLQFVDVPKARMAGANTLSSTIAQIATGLGVAVGALILRASQALLEGTQDAAPVTSYQWTFAVLGLLMLYPVIEALRMHRTAGDLVR